MARRLFAHSAFLILTLVSPGLVRAADVPSALAPGYNSIRAADLQADLTFLASDALEGRLSLSRGSEVALEWIRAEFTKAGLKPAAGGSYLQPVPLWDYRADRQHGFVRVQQSGKETEFSFPDAFGQFPDDVNLSGAVVFAGYGITAPELGYDDYRNIDVKGKIVLVFDHEPQETDPKSIFNGTGNTRYATVRVKALNAQAHGAAGLLIVAEPNRKHPSNQERQARIAGGAQRVARIPAEAIVDDELHIPSMILSDLAAANILAPLGISPADLQAAIDKDLSSVSRVVPGTEVTIHLQNSARRRGVSYNVAGLLEGSDPTLAAETIVISGHYDHDGAANTDGNAAQIWHGADDNGSGTVGVVELARAFAHNPQRPKRSILFIVFAAEERGLLGSYFYVQHPLRSLESTRAVINFDMIGRNEETSEQTKGLIEIAADTTNELNLIGTNYSPDYRQAVEAANQRIGLHLNYKWDHEASLNVFFRSDQFPFALRGIPAIWWFTGFHPDYHQTTDTADKINYAKMEKILKLAYLSAWTFASQPKPPVFNLRTN
jgi:Peptidase family M28/PA domain